MWYYGRKNEHEAKPKKAAETARNYECLGVAKQRIFVKVSLKQSEIVKKKT